MPSRILVTGGAGYIGSHTCKALAEAGYTPITYDNLSNGYEELVKWGPLEIGDVRDRRRLTEAVQAHEPQACIHFAGLIQVGESVKEPEMYHDNNVNGSNILIDVLLKSGVNRFIFSSSAAVYGEPLTSPIPDDHPLAPINPYGENKMAVEATLAQLGQEGRMRSVSLRYFNAAGADPDGESGENHDPETHLIPLILDAASGKRPRITVFGDDYDTPDGTCLRDYIHVTDLARAHLQALQRIGEGSGARAYNLGNGQAYSVLEVIDMVRRITGKEIPMAVGPRREGDPPVLVADSSRIKEDLGWKPEFEDLGVIVETAWEWNQRVSSSQFPDSS